MPKFRTFLAAILCFLTSVLALAAVDLNQATEAELETLPGVGPSIARNIVTARPFKSVEDLRNVKGIGAAKFTKIAPLVSAGPVATTAPTPDAVIPVPPQAAPAMPSASAPAAAAQRARSAANSVMPGERINLNTASQADIERLPGIGPKKAKAIIEARPFKSPDDVMRVKGIKQGTYARIRDNITVE